MPTSATLLKFLRQAHLYIGIFISPAILFFALTGALQTFSLHETLARPQTTQAPKWIATLGPDSQKSNRRHPQEAHRPQARTLRKTPGSKPHKHEAPVPRARPPPLYHPTLSRSPPCPQTSGTSTCRSKSSSSLSLIGLFTSTLTGLYMAWKFNRSRVAIVTLFLAGILIPLFLAQVLVACPWTQKSGRRSRPLSRRYSAGQPRYRRPTSVRSSATVKAVAAACVKAAAGRSVIAAANATVISATVATAISSAGITATRIPATIAKNRSRIQRVPDSNRVRSRSTSPSR